eukprot:4148663-Pleurochrysis_carterae.AAC.3
MNRLRQVRYRIAVAGIKAAAEQDEQRCTSHPTAYDDDSPSFHTAADLALAPIAALATEIERG